MHAAHFRFYACRRALYSPRASPTRALRLGWLPRGTHRGLYAWLGSVAPRQSLRDSSTTSSPVRTPTNTCAASVGGSGAGLFTPPVYHRGVSTLRKVVATVGELGAVGETLANCLVFDLETHRLEQVKLGGLAIWDRKRRDARRAARAARRHPGP
jgi:hypothetical protein